MKRLDRKIEEMVRTAPLFHWQLPKAGIRVGTYKRLSLVIGGHTADHCAGAGVIIKATPLGDVITLVKLNQEQSKSCFEIADEALGISRPDPYSIHAMWADYEWVCRADGEDEATLRHKREAFYTCAFSVISELGNYRKDLDKVLAAWTVWDEEAAQHLAVTLDMGEQIPPIAHVNRN